MWSFSGCGPTSPAHIKIAWPGPRTLSKVVSKGCSPRAVMLLTFIPGKNYKATVVSDVRNFAVVRNEGIS